MVKPDIPDGQPTDSSRSANSHIAKLPTHINDGKSQLSREDCERRLYEGIDKKLQVQNASQKDGGTGEFSQEQDDLDRTRSEMLDGKFTNIRDSHGRNLTEHFGVSLHDHVLKTIPGREPSPRQDDLETYNIKTKNGSFRQQLVDLSNSCPITGDHPKFRVVCFLGKGAEAECFLCEDVNTKKRIVHKKYYGKPRGRERDTLAKLRHRSIPAFYGAAVEDGRHVLRMEFCGESLRHLKNNRQFSEAELWEILEQLTDVLSHLDNHHVIHRDIKPDNVCIQTSSGGLITKLIDFGSVQTAQDKVAQHGRLTAAYMAPELWLLCMSSATPVSSKSDVFACALTICYLVYDFDVVPQALSTSDETQMLNKMIHNPSGVADYVKKTFPLDKYSQALKNLLLKMLDGIPGRRISATDAHKEIVTHCMRPYFEDIRKIPGIDILLGSAISDGVQYQSEPTRQCTAAPLYVTGLTLPIPTDQQANGMLIHGTAETTTLTIAMKDGGNQHSFINGAVQTKSNHQPENALTDDSLHGLEEQVLELEPVNYDAGITAVPESASQIPNQEQLHLIQDTIVSNRAGEPNLKLGRCQLAEDCQDGLNPACLTKAQDPPAKQETIDKLKDRLKTGTRKRSCPVLPNEYTNMPNLDLIQCKKKR